MSIALGNPVIKSPSKISGRNRHARRRRAEGKKAFHQKNDVPGRTQPSGSGTGSDLLPDYVRIQNYKSLKQSSFDRTGGNADRWPIQPDQTLEVFQAAGPGMISHIWFTISAQSGNHLKELVIRMYWEGNAKPSVPAHRRSPGN